MVFDRPIALALALTLAACGEPAERERAQVQDPAMTEAIEGQLMVDPDLTQQNMRNFAVVPGSPAEPAPVLRKQD